MDRGGCRNLESQLAEARRYITTVIEEIHRTGEAEQDAPELVTPAACPHCGHALDASQPATADGLTTEALTGREHEVLLLLAAGLSNRRISRRLGIAEKTVKNHLAAIFSKLGVHDRTQAAVYAIRAGMGS